MCVTSLLKLHSRSPFETCVSQVSSSLRTHLKVGGFWLHFSSCGTNLDLLMAFDNRVFCKLTLSLVLLSPPLSPLFEWGSQSNEILLNLGMKCWVSAFNAQGSRTIMIIVQVGAVKIYVAAVEALKKKEREDETQFPTKNTVLFWVSPPPWMLIYLDAGFLKNLTRFWTKLRVLVLCFLDFSHWITT